jgi:uncharacterized membrane protein
MLDLLISLVSVGFVVFLGYCWFRIFEKLGYGGWSGLAMFVPILNFIILIWLAFTEWPIERRQKILSEDSKKNIV